MSEIGSALANKSRLNPCRLPHRVGTLLTGLIRFYPLKSIRGLIKPSCMPGAL